MRLRETCKCGASFEARGSADNVAELWDGWRILHASACYGVEKLEKIEKGKWKLTIRRDVAGNGSEG